MPPQGPPPGAYPPQGPPPGLPPGAYPPQGPPPGSYPPPGQYFSPGEARPYTSPGDAGWQGQYPPPYGQPYGKAAGPGPDKSRTFIIAAIIVALVVVAASAGVYFLVIKKGGGATAPEQTVIKYFDAVSSGDSSAVRAMFAPDSQPSDMALKLLSSVYSSGMLKWSDFKLKTLTQTATDATVQIEDATISVSLAGQSMKEHLSTFNTSGQPMVFKLKNVSGQWLLTSDGSMNVSPNLPNMPSIPTSPTNSGT